MIEQEKLDINDLLDILANAIMQHGSSGAYHPEIINAENAIITLVNNSGWQPIETAPRGSGINGQHLVTHPDYVKPPKILLFTEDGPLVGYYDWYYHEGYGRGYEPGVSAWRNCDGEQAFGPTHWMPLPEKPE